MSESLARWRKRALIIWAAVGICVLFSVLGFLLQVLAVPVSVVVWCVIFVFCLNPIVESLYRRGIGRGTGTLIAFIVLALIIAVVLWLFLAPDIGASAQFMMLAQSLPGYVASLTQAASDLAQRYPDFFNDPTIQSWMADAADSLSGFFSDFANAAGAGVVGLGTFIASAAVVIGFSLVISFWILMELPGINRELRRLISPARLDDFELFSDTLGMVIGGYIKATLLQCVIIGVCCGIGYAVLGLPSAAALGIITGILNIIPVVGPWLGGAVAAAVGFVVSPLTAIIAIIIAVVVQQVVYTFISPLLMADSVDIHPALVIFGLALGSAVGNAMGGLGGSILGMLASIPLIAAMKALFVYYYEGRTGRRIVAPDGVFFKGAVPVVWDGAVDPTLDASAPTPQHTAPLGKNVYPERHHDEHQKEVMKKRHERRAIQLSHMWQAGQQEGEGTTEPEAKGEK